MRIQAVVFDWAGTVVDFGSVAPALTFVEAFRAHQVEPTIAEARAPMGLPKRDHIAQMFAGERIADAWRTSHGTAPDQASVDAVYATFLPLSENVVATRTKLIPGASDTAKWLRAEGIKIGSTTGYTRSIMQHVIPAAAAQGFAPDVVVCSDELVEGRPGPLGIYKNMVELGVYPPEAILKVDDTPAGIAEGVSAGSPTVGITWSGNLVGLTEEDLECASDEDVAQLVAEAEITLKDAGANHVIRSVADLPALIERLNA